MVNIKGINLNGGLPTEGSPPLERLLYINEDLEIEAGYLVCENTLDGSQHVNLYGISVI